MEMKYKEYTASLENFNERIAVTEARENFGELVDRTYYSKDRLVLTKHGKPYAGLVCEEDLLRLEIFDQIINGEMMDEYSSVPSNRGVSLDRLNAEYTDSPKKNGTGG